MPDSNYFMYITYLILQQLSDRQSHCCFLLIHLIDGEIVAQRIHLPRRTDCIISRAKCKMKMGSLLKIRIFEIKPSWGLC